MFSALARSWQLTEISFGMLRFDRELLAHAIGRR
jgi:hypothetical protein